MSEELGSFPRVEYAKVFTLNINNNEPIRELDYFDVEDIKRERESRAVWARALADYLECTSSIYSARVREELRRVAELGGE